MSQRIWSWFIRKLVENAEDYYGGPAHRLEKSAAKASEEALGFAAATERGRLGDGRQSPPTVVPPQPRRTPAEERRRINDLPIP